MKSLPDSSPTAPDVMSSGLKRGMGDLYVVHVFSLDSTDINFSNMAEESSDESLESTPTKRVRQ